MAALYLVGKGQWLAAVVLSVAGRIGFSGAISFYDSLLVNVAAPREMDRVSALGYSLGYLGSGLLFALNVAMALKPDFFGTPDAALATRLSLWWPSGGSCSPCPCSATCPNRPHRRPPSRDGPNCGTR